MVPNKSSPVLGQHYEDRKTLFLARMSDAGQDTSDLSGSQTTDASERPKHKRNSQKRHHASEVNQRLRRMFRQRKSLAGDLTCPDTAKLLAYWAYWGKSAVVKLCQKCQK